MKEKFLGQSVDSDCLKKKTPRRILESKRPEVTKCIKRSFIIRTAYSSAVKVTMIKGQDSATHLCGRGANRIDGKKPIG
jgi:hypothetical protein